MEKRAGTLESSSIYKMIMITVIAESLTLGLDLLPRLCLLDKAFTMAISESMFGSDFHRACDKVPKTLASLHRTFGIFWQANLLLVHDEIWQDSII